MTVDVDACIIPGTNPRAAYQIRCPICHRLITIRIAQTVLDHNDQYPMAHVIVHRKPPHAITVYVDHDGNIRGIEQCNGVQFDFQSAKVT
jgi:hypothetical protein